MKPKHRQLLLLGIATTLVLCTGCASTARVQIAHYSHSSAGAPFGPKSQEDGLTVLEVVGRWELPFGIYTEAGIGYNVKGRNGGGFYGPAEVTSLKIGKEWRFK